MIGFTIFFILVSAYFAYKHYKKTQYPQNAILQEIYQNLISLYPKTYFFGVRIIKHPSHSHLKEELMALGLSRITEIEKNHITVWKNQENDIFIVQAIGYEHEQKLLVPKDAQIGRYFFYAYESIITIPINTNSKGLLTYFRQLSLSFNNPETSTSIWITKCECLPGYNYLQNQLPQTLKTIHSKMTLSELLKTWLTQLHLEALQTIPQNISPTLKGEYIAIAHQISYFFKSIDPSFTGQLARPIQFGYVALLNTTENSEIFDRLYAHWYIAPKDMLATASSDHPWTKLLRPNDNENPSLQGVFISLSLFMIFALSAKLVSERISHQHNHRAQATNVAPPLQAMHVENQLLSEIGSSINPQHLLKLLELHRSMQKLPAQKNRCTQYQSLIQKSADCNQVDNIKLKALPNDLIERSQQIFSNLTAAEKMTLIAPHSSDDIQASIRALNVSESCQNNAILKQFNAELFPDKQCASQIKSSLIATLAMAQVEKIASQIVPINDNDSLSMLLNKTEYYTHNIDTLISNIPSQLKQLNQLSQSHQLDYKIHSKIKSLTHLTQHKKKLVKTMTHAHGLLKQLKEQQPGQLVGFYKNHIMNDPQLLKSISQKPLDAKDEWTNAIFKVVLKQIKTTVSNNIDKAYQPIQRSHKQFLENKFPLSSSGEDADMQAFNQLLAPNGLINQFFKAYINPLINTQHNDWIWSSHPEFALPLNKNLLNTQMQIALTNEMFFHKKPQAWFESSMKITRLSPNVQSVTIQTGNQSQTLQKNASAQIIRWVSADANHNISSITLEHMDKTKSQLPFQGDFSGLRLLQSLKIINKQSNQLFTAKIQIENEWAELEIQMPHSINPLVQGISDQYDLQEKIMNS
jgi:hypothetical protein